MSHVLIAVGGLAVLFVSFGLLQRGRQRTTCEHCTCHGGTCERADESRHLELVESPDAGT